MGLVKAAQVSLLLPATATLNPWVAIAAGIGAALVVINRLVTANRWAVDSAKKMALEHTRVAGSLDVYAGALENLNKKAEEGNDVNKEYSAQSSV